MENFRRDLRLATSVADFTKALAISDEIKRLIRSKTFGPLPDRLSELRRILIAIRSSDVGLSAKQRSTFQSAIVNFKKLELQVDDFTAGKQAPQNISTLTQPICDDVDLLQEILTYLQTQIGSTKL